MKLLSKKLKAFFEFLNIYKVKQQVTGGAICLSPSLRIIFNYFYNQYLCSVKCEILNLFYPLFIYNSLFTSTKIISRKISVILSVLDIIALDCNK